jgi:streptogramin lyase
MRFDAAGRLWVAGFVDGELGRLDTATMQSRVYPLPEFASGHAATPYALAVHPRTGDVWINEVMTDRLYRFIPREERFIAYPMPLKDTYTREISFAADGSLCTSNNPIPRAALEGGILELICLDPDRGRVAGR